MNLYQSGEVRWFWKGGIPPEISSAFDDFNESLIQENRTDRYLIFPKNVHLGVKLREGNFEIKALLETGDNIKVGRSRLVATCEIWQKVSLTNFNWEPATGEVTEVIKSRWSCHFVRDNEQWVKSDALSSYADSCQIELTEIKILEEKYWSWALEATGTDPDLCDLLTSMWAKLSEETSLIQQLETRPDLIGAHSFPSFFKVLGLGD